MQACSGTCWEKSRLVAGPVGAGATLEDAVDPIDCNSKRTLCGWLLQLVAKWRELAEQSRWDEFVAAMLQEHYDAVYTRAQLKYLTPSTSQDTQDHTPAASAVSNSQSALSSLPSSQHDATSNGHVDWVHQQDRCASGVAAAASSEDSSQAGGQVGPDRDSSRGDDETVEAAGALSHLFGGPRQKLMQQMSTKEAESTLRWHRERVEDMSDETYTALAQKLLRQYDPAALSQKGLG